MHSIETARRSRLTGALGFVAALLAVLAIAVARS
jgi:hypothetical protein